MRYEKLESTIPDGYGTNGTIAWSNWYLAEDGTLRQIGGNSQGDKWDRVYQNDRGILEFHKKTGEFIDMDL